MRPEIRCNILRTQNSTLGNSLANPLGIINFRETHTHTPANVLIIALTCLKLSQFALSLS